MKRNVASQVVGWHLVNKTDGSEVTSGTTTVYVTGDGGTQAAGSVGSGAATHEGHGYWTYAPAQAETDYDQVAFTFVNSSAVTGGPTIYPSFPQTGDNFARIGSNGSGLTSLASQSSVDDLPTNAELSTALGTADDAVLAAIAALNNLSQANIRTAVGLGSANLDTQLAAIDTKTTNLPSDPADQSLIIAATNALSALIGTPAVSVAADVAAVKSDTAAILTDTGTTLDGKIDAIKTATDKVEDTLELDGAVYRFTLNALELAPSGGASAADIADAVWDEATADHQTAGTTGKALTSASSAGDPWTTEFDGKTAGEILQLIAAFALGKTTIVKVGSNIATVTFRAIDDSADRIVATVNRSERTGVTLTP